MLKITIELTDHEELIMNDMVISIEDWFRKGPYKEKIENHKKRIKDLMRQKYLKKNLPFPQDEDEFIEKYFSDPLYKNRKERDKEQKIENLKRFNKLSSNAEQSV